MKGAWCYDWDKMCTWGILQWMWPLLHPQLLSLVCVTQSLPGAVWTEPSGLWASPFGSGWLPGVRLHPLSCVGLSSLAVLCSAARDGHWGVAEGMGSLGWWLWGGQAFSFRFYKFSLLLRLCSFIFWHWKVPIVVCEFFGVYGRDAAAYESSRSCHLMFASASPPSLAARQSGANRAYGKQPQKDFGTNIYFLGWKWEIFIHCVSISAIPGSFLL